MLTPKELTEQIVRVADSKKAKDIVVLKTGDLTVIADYFIICTATSAPHIKTLSDEIGKQMSELGEPPLRVEGYRNGGWVLLDFGCTIIHLFTDEMRKFYSLERLWSDAEQIDISNILTV